MMPVSAIRPARLDAEEARIREAYARRPADDPRYSWLNPGYAYMNHERQRETLRLIARFAPAPLDALRILDLGCGTGQWIRDLVSWGASPERITGVDLLADRILEARRRCAPAVTLRQASAADPDVADGAFDLVIQSTVFSSILDGAVRAAVAQRMLRALAPGGIILWYDFFVNNPRNRDVRGVPRRELAQLFPGCTVHSRRITLAAPLARRIAPVAPGLCTMLARLRLPCTHLLAVISR